MGAKSDTCNKNECAHEQLKSNSSTTRRKVLQENVHDIVSLMKQVHIKVHQVHKTKETHSSIEKVGAGHFKISRNT